MSDPGGNRSPESEACRDLLGRRVREVWVAWAQRQENPKPSWLVSYDELSEADKEADRCIGAALWGDGFNQGLEVGLLATHPGRSTEAHDA